MSLASSLRPVSLSFGSALHHSSADVATKDVPFHHESNYLQLQRMLIRYQSLILLASPLNSKEETNVYDLTPLQRQIQAELYQPLPYHRTKWLHSIESARNLLLTLERQAQNIKSPRAKRDALRDLAGKKQVIKRLKNRINDIGVEVESGNYRSSDVGATGDAELLGERADAILARMGHGTDYDKSDDKLSASLEEGKPIYTIGEDKSEEHAESHLRDALLGSSLRKRQGQNDGKEITSPELDRGTSSGFSNLASTEKSLQGHAREHEDLTSALVSMAAQLKQQSRAFQFSLGQDKNFLNRAVEGLDLNITTMEAASKNMAFLRRMSEEQGFFGRLKLYGIILAMWVIAILLVFVGPKLRF